jgi:hypothetical protein
MRYHKISSGYQIPVSSEEEDILKLCHEKPIKEADLDERTAYMAQEMNIRGILRRIYDEDRNVFYEPDSLDLWRF